MRTLPDAVVPRLRLRTGDDWEVSYKKRFRANKIVWGMPRDLTTLEIRAKFADLGLVSFVRGREGEHVRLVVTPRDSKGLTKELVGQVSSSLRKIGCRCVLDETIRDKSRSKPVHIDYINRFEPLSKQADSSCRDEHVDVNLVEGKVKALAGNKRERRLRVATWNFSGLGSECKLRKLKSC